MRYKSNRKNKPKIAVTTYHKSQHAEDITVYLKLLVPEYNILTKGIYQETRFPNIASYMNRREK